MRSGPRGKVTIRGVLLIAAALALIVTAVAPARQLLRQRAEIDRLEKTLAQVKETNEQLKEETQRLNTDAYIEQQARERLGLIRPGEEPFLVVPPKQEPPKADKQAEVKKKAEEKKVDKSWWQAVVDFFKGLIG